jgi:hypothetical protein
MVLLPSEVLFNAIGKRVNSFKRLLPEVDGVRYDE